MHMQDGLHTGQALVQCVLMLDVLLSCDGDLE